MSRLFSLQTVVFMIVIPAWSQQLVTVDLADRPDTLRRVIDFFEPGSDISNADLLALKPRFVTAYSGGSWYINACKGKGIVPVLNCMGRDSASASSFVKSSRANGVRYFQVWSEPNRTFGGSYDGQSDNWLRSVSWDDFIRRAELIYRGGFANDTGAKFIGPVLTSDASTGHDPDWFQHVVQFCAYFAQRNYRIDYIAINPPYHPEHVRTIANFARGFAKANPQCGVKGVCFGEWPFFLDSVAVHIRFLNEFERGWNVLYAAKSHFRESSTNSGLINASGRKPVYWLFHRYARMTGRRLASAGALGDSICALASYDDSTRKCYLLVANDTRARHDIRLRLRNTKGGATAAVSRFTSTGLTQVQTAAVEAADSVMELSLGEVTPGAGLDVELTFEHHQDIVAVRRQLRADRTFPGVVSPRSQLHVMGIRSGAPCVGGTFSLSGRRRHAELPLHGGLAPEH